MDAQLHVEALLHLSALSLILAIAYLGLDRVHLEKDVFLEALEKARAKAVTFVRRYDITPGQTPNPTSMFYRFPFWVKLKFYALCQVAGVNGNIPMGFSWRVLHCCHRQRYVPLLGYFNKRRDRAWVSIFAAVLLAIFLYVTAVALWKLEYFPADFWDGLHWFHAKDMLTPAYWVCVFILFWIFFTVGITHILQHIEAICDRLESASDEHMKAIASDVTRNSLNHAEDQKPEEPAKPA